MTLDPTPDAVLAFVERALVEPWPARDRRAYFAALDLVETGEPDIERAPFVTGWFRSSLVPGTWSTWDGELLGLSLFLYSVHETRNAETTARFEAICDLLAKCFGLRLTEWSEGGSVSTRWELGQIDLDLSCFVRVDSQVMVSLEHRGRERAFESRASLDA